MKMLYDKVNYKVKVIILLHERIKFVEKVKMYSIVNKIGTDRVRLKIAGV